MIIKEWEHEPQTFWFEEIRRGTRSYLPDFKITLANKSHYWVEVKGYFDRKSLTKIKRFRKYYPEEDLRIVDGEWFKLHDFKTPQRPSMEKEEAALSVGKRWVPNRRPQKGLLWMG